MSEFKVKAGWPDGSVAEQSIVAADISAARFEIERRGGHVFEVRRKGLSLGRKRGATHGRIKMSEFLIFNQELIALLKAGLPVVRSFEILLERQKSPTLRRVLGDVRQRVNSGASISEAFAAEGDLFPRLYWTSLKAGEKSGEIETVLRRYLKYQKTVIAMSRKVVSTLIYPAILVGLSVGLIAILMTYVIPRFTEFFADFEAELPLLTVVVLGVANFMQMKMTFSVKADYARFKRLLRAFETNKRWIAVRSIAITRDNEQPGSVTVQIELVTYFAEPEAGRASEEASATRASTRKAG